MPGLETGQAALFDDERIRWFEARLGGFAGVRVLELGPLDVRFDRQHGGATFGLLCDLGRLSDRIGLWTHYFDPEILCAHPGAQEKFAFSPRLVSTPQGREVALYDQQYLQALDWNGFCGGAAHGSVWMTRQGILEVLADQGFACEIGFDHREHQNGPAFCVFARRGG